MEKKWISAVCDTTETTYVFFTTLVRDQEVEGGSNPFAPTTFTLVQPGHIGDTPNRLHGSRNFKVADDSGIKSFAFSTQFEPRFKREPTLLVGRKRNADQTWSMATMDTARHPAALIASRITSRLSSLPVFEVFFG